MLFALILGKVGALFDILNYFGGVAEWLKAAVLKTVERKFRGFKSYLLRQFKVECSKDLKCSKGLTAAVLKQNKLVAER